MPYFKSLAQSLYFVGTFTAALLAGMISDWFGRKKAFLIFLVASIVFWFVSYFIDNLYLWLALRFCIGASVMAFTVATSVYGVSNLMDINMNMFRLDKCRITGPPLRDSSSKASKVLGNGLWVQWESRNETVG